MKKVISLMLIMFFLCSLCLPIVAASRTVDDVLKNAEKKVEKYYYEFENRCLYIPASMNPAIFANINVEIEGEEVYLNSVASLEKTEDDEVIIISEEEKTLLRFVLLWRRNYRF